MGPTSIRRGSEFLQRAGWTFEDLATVMPFQISVLVASHPFSQADLNKYTKALNHFQENVWIQDFAGRGKGSPSPKSDGDYATAEPPTGFGVPRASISPALAERKRPSSFRGEETDADAQQPLTYILIVQGKEAGARWKVISQDSLQGVARSILHEVVNRYSVVFSGAVLASDFQKLQDNSANFTFERAENITHLNEIAGNGKAKQIGVWC